MAENSLENGEETYEQARKRHEIGHSGAPEITRNERLSPAIGPVRAEREEQRRQLATLRARMAMDSEAQELERRRQRAAVTAERFALLRDRDAK